jgi:single-stranded-DNA-specific exonuclease
MNKKWELYNSDETTIRNVAEKYNISEILATVLVNRNVLNDEEVNVFLNPTRNDFHDPYEMPDMYLAVDRIIKAMENKEKVIIYGDYDVDGITSTMVLKKFLDEHGLEVHYRIPNRLNEGYGLNMQAIKEIAEQGYKLIITVDCRNFWY